MGSNAIVFMFTQILDGMKVLHEQGTGHGDLEFGVSIVGGNKVKFVNMAVDRIGKSLWRLIILGLCIFLIDCFGSNLHCCVFCSSFRLRP